MASTISRSLREKKVNFPSPPRVFTQKSLHNFACVNNFFFVLFWHGRLGHRACACVCIPIWNPAGTHESCQQPNKNTSHLSDGNLFYCFVGIVNILLYFM